MKKLVERMPSIKSIDQSFLIFFPNLENLGKKKERGILQQNIPFFTFIFWQNFWHKKMMVDIGSKKSKRIPSKKIYNVEFF